MKPSLLDIRRAIPAHCFESNALRSLSYVARDVVVATVLVVVARRIYEQDVRLFALLYAPYCFVLGATFMGFFVLGHDAGHGTFSRHRWLNFAVGTALHAAVLTPFTAWQLTHRSHHANTGHIDRDEVFRPIRARDHHPSWFEHHNLADFAFGVGVGWWAYLFIGYSPRQQLAYHYDVRSPLFERHRLEASVSLAALVVCAALVCAWAARDGAWLVFLLYVVPLNVFACFLVVITFLHHADVGRVTWRSGDEWTFTLGALASVDRSYGTWLDDVLHDIGTHQVHHLFPFRVPHYHLREATRAFRAAFPRLVHVADEKESVWCAFMRNARNYRDAHVVDDACQRVCI